MEPRVRRTQEERRLATQTALLDATIDCLIEYGYAGTTTNRIADRAGVSRGAQVHYYPSKAELVAEAVRRLAERQAAEFADLPTGRRRAEAAVDALWERHTGPLYQAAVELFVAARTDPELARHLGALEDVATARLADGARAAFGESARSRGFAADFAIAIAAVQGLALLRMAGQNPELIDRRWRAMRKRLIAMLTAYVEDVE